MSVLTATMRRTPTLNARVAAVSLVVGAVALHLVNQLSLPLVPIRLVVVGVLLLGAWAFSDEMGLRKPLNKVAFICFVFSMSALAVTVLGNDETDRTQFNLIYAMALLFAVAVWSGAYLHRSRGLKAIGAIGGIAALLPLAAIVAGHVFVGLGTYLGVDALLEPAHDETALGSLPVNAVEAVFIVWCLATAVLLLRGHIDSVSETTNHEKSRSTDLSNA